jgi:hypothetical protein
LKAPGFNPSDYQVKTWLPGFKPLLSNSNLHRYTEAGAALSVALQGLVARGCVDKISVERMFGGGGKRAAAAAAYGGKRFAAGKKMA